MAKAEKKAYFITELDFRLKHGSDKIYILDSPLRYWSPKYGTVQAPAEFYFDGASVPRVPIVYAIWGNRAHREAGLHDLCFCKDAINHMTGKPFTFMEANDLFLESMTATGKPFYIRYPMYAAVCAFSYPCFHKRKVFDKL